MIFIYIHIVNEIIHSLYMSISCFYRIYIYYTLHLYWFVICQATSNKQLLFFFLGWAGCILTGQQGSMLQAAEAKAWNVESLRWVYRCPVDQVLEFYGKVNSYLDVSWMLLFSNLLKFSNGHMSKYSVFPVVIPLGYSNSFHLNSSCNIDGTQWKMERLKMNSFASPAKYGHFLV